MSVFFTRSFIESFLFSIIRVSTPLIFPAMGAVLTKKAGVMNMAIESQMLWAALTGVLVSAFTQNVVLGFLGAIAASVLISGFIAYMALYLRSNMYLTCIATNLASVGGTVFAMYLACGDKGTSTSLASLTLPRWNIPIIKDIPFIGRVLSGHNMMVYVAFVSVVVTYVLVYKTATGLRIRAVGENPDAAESVGVNVRKIRTISLLLSGVFAGFGGCFMSMGYVSWFSRNMVAGRGFISMSAANLANGEPIGTLVACLVFGAADASANVLQSLKIPPEFVMMIPYLATIVGLVVVAIRNDRKIKKLKTVKGE